LEGFVTHRSIQEVAEAAQLLRAVKDIEALLANSNALRGSTSNTVLTAMLDSTKKRIAEIERDELKSSGTKRRMKGRNARRVRTNWPSLTKHSEKPR